MSSFFLEKPSFWTRAPLKYLAENPKNGAWGSEAGDDEQDAICVRVADFDWERLSLVLSDHTVRSFTAAQVQNLRLQKDDILLEKSGGGEKTPVGRLVRFDDQRLAVTSNFVARIRPRKNVDAGFLLYLLAAQYMSRFSFQFVKQSTGIQNLDDTALFRSDVWVPSVSNQKRISAFLDRETARIDGLIAKKERLVDVLNATHAATSLRVMAPGIGEAGFDPDHNRVTFSRLAAGWQRVRVKQVASHMTSGSRGWSDLIQDEGELFLQSGSIDRHMGVSYSEAQRVAPQTGAEAARTKVRNGDTLVCITGGRTGAVGHVSGLCETAYINQHVCLIRPSAAINPRLLSQILFSEIGRLHFRMAQYGLKQGLGFEQVANTTIPLPPRDIQDKISEDIDKSTEKTRSVVEMIGRSIDKVKEYRAALITAAVTGQIDVETYGKTGKASAELDRIEEMAD